jgi:uncharacterized protein YgiM (DUF1202 family)
VRNANAVLRGGAGTSFDVIAQIPSGTSVEIINLARNIGWANVRLADGTTGWVISDVVYPVVVQPTATPTIAGVQSASVCRQSNVREGAGTGYLVVYVAQPQERIEVSESRVSLGQVWYRLAEREAWIIGTNIAIEPMGCP